MENSLMTGDYLFVSKLAYGPKLPQTPISMPFVHNVLPISGKESYLKFMQFDYKRIKGIGTVKRDDYVVFSFPNGDTVLKKAITEDYYTHVRMSGREYTQKTLGPIIVRPVDKKDHYVKRCVAIAGDTLKIKNGVVFINGEAQTNYHGIRNTYTVITNGSAINSIILKKFGINSSEVWYNQALPGYPDFPLNSDDVKELKALGNVVSVDQNIDVYPPDYPDSPEMLFPFVDLKWTRDNYGPLWIPSKGATVKLTLENLPLYRRIIDVYEENDLMVQYNTIIINGEVATEYTFKQNYYFMMGDNRHNSLDSRYWGFVPEDHIVGKPAVIWFSSDTNKTFPNNIRWKRILKFV
jgi:signal peptidase I